MALVSEVPCGRCCVWSLVAQPWVVVVSWYLSPRALDPTFSAERCWGEAHGQEKFNKKSRCGVLGLFQLFTCVAQSDTFLIHPRRFAWLQVPFASPGQCACQCTLCFHTPICHGCWHTLFFDSHNTEAPEGDPGCFSRGIRGDPRGSRGIRSVLEFAGHVSDIETATPRLRMQGGSGW